MDFTYAIPVPIEEKKLVKNAEKDVSIKMYNHVFRLNLPSWKYGELTLKEKEIVDKINEIIDELERLDEAIKRK